MKPTRHSDRWAGWGANRGGDRGDVADGWRRGGGTAPYRALADGASMRPVVGKEGGVALVVTLIMLSLVTFLTVAFLSVARRERSSMLVSQSQTDAKNAADSGLALAQSAVLAQMFALTNMHNYGLMISTNVDTAGGSPAALATLQFLPRAPVYVTTNSAAAPDFRFFLDFNRNGMYETNGGYPFYVGDPEWIGMLEYPNVPHGPTNRFVGRMAYIVLPASKSLDLNYIHNQAKQLGVGNDGFLRNQGYASWELNLAAFLNELNTGVWAPFTYQTAAIQSLGISFTDAKDLLIYRYNGSYNNLQTVNLAFAPNNFAGQAVTVDGLGNGPLMLGGAFANYTAAQQDNSAARWSGGENLSATAQRYYDMLELFTPGRTYNNFMGRFTNAMNGPVGSSNNYTFYTMLAQLGVDSAAPKHRMNINYTNDFNLSADSATNLVRWTPEGFFTNAADLMIKAGIITNVIPGALPVTNYYFGSSWLGSNYFGGPPFGITNIPVYPFSYYTPEVHRTLQVAANIYDASAGNQFPSVFRPLFKNIGGAVSIVGYRYEPDATFLAGLTNLNLDLPGDQLLLSNSVAGAYHVRGIPFILGARKGFPNFNEFALQTVLTATRKLELTKPFSTNAFMFPNATNQMLIYGISNRFFMEAWNSYVANYPRALQMTVTNISAISLTNQFTNLVTSFYTNTAVYNFAANSWTGNTFQVVALNTVNFLTNSVMSGFSGGTNPPVITPVGPGNRFSTNGFEVPDLGLSVSNWLQFTLVDTTVTPNRLVDYVNFANLTDGLNLNAALGGISNRFAANSPGQFWVTNRVAGSNGPTLGILNQIAFASTAVTPFSSNLFLWQQYNSIPMGGTNVNWEVAKMQQFITGTNQFGYRMRTSGTNMQVPFTPTMKVYRNLSWEVNDPLVHTLASDLYRPPLPFPVWDPLTVYPTNAIVQHLGVGYTAIARSTNQVPRFSMLFWSPLAVQGSLPPQVKPTRAPIPPPASIGDLNLAYRPWGGKPGRTNVLSTFQDFDLSLKDPGIRRSDDWQFPNGSFANIGWLGQVHRGTPWQTLYMKSAVTRTNDWYVWANSYETHPTNDWRLFSVFTVAINDAASRGTLSINQTNIAAWSALFSGVQVLSNNNQNVVISPNSYHLTYMVDGINKIRSQMIPAGFGSFTNLGDILRVPHLTTASPFINFGVPLWHSATNYNNGDWVAYEGRIYYYYQTFATSNRPPDVNLTHWGPVNQVTPQMQGLTDFIYERIPMQTLSLMNLEEEPRLVIYSYGQSLKPAERSVQVSPLLGALRGISTNYTVTGEVVIRSLVRVRNAPQIGQTGPFFPQIVVESYDILPSD